MFGWTQAFREIEFGNSMRRIHWPQGMYIESQMTVQKDADPEVYPYADRHGVRFRIVKRNLADPDVPAEVWEPSRRDRAASNWTFA